MMWGKLMSLRSRGAGLFVLFATCVPYKKSDRPWMMTSAHVQLGRRHNGFLFSCVIIDRRKYIAKYNDLLNS